MSLSCSFALAYFVSLCVTLSSNAARWTSAMHFEETWQKRDGFSVWSIPMRQQWCVFTRTTCIWIWVVLFSPLPFWFSHIGFYRSLFIHLKLFKPFFLFASHFVHGCVSFHTLFSIKFGRRRWKKHRDFCRWINFSWSVATYNLQHWHIDDDTLNEINWPKHFLLLHFLPFFRKERARYNSNDEYTERKDRERQTQKERNCKNATYRKPKITNCHRRLDLLCA